MKLLVQRHTNNKYGYFMQIVQQLSVVSQVISLCLLIVTTTSILQARGYNISVWLLGGIIASLIVIAGSIVFTLGLPSYYEAFNEQFYKHNNPMRKDLEAIKKKLGIEDGN